MNESLRTSLAETIDAGILDLVQDGDDVEIRADRWTIVIPADATQPAFVAIDDVTESDTEHRAALDSSFSDADVAMLRAADAAVAGALVARLAASPDRLTVLLAERLG